MDWKRFWRHVAMSPARAARCFPPATREAIAREVAAGERRHRGEVRFIVEAELETMQLWRGLTSRERAREVFAAHGVWNTEENNGVLIYVLLADRRVEIVADRGLEGRVSVDEWRAICDRMDAHFHEHRYADGALGGVREVSALLERHFPPAGPDANELDNHPLMV